MSGVIELSIFGETHGNFEFPISLLMGALFWVGFLMIPVHVATGEDQNANVDGKCCPLIVFRWCIVRVFRKKWESRA